MCVTSSRHKVSTYGELAEEAAQVLRKGQRVAVHGRLRVDEWTDRLTQQPRRRHKIVAGQLAVVASDVRMLRLGACLHKCLFTNVIEGRWTVASIPSV